MIISVIIFLVFIYLLFCQYNKSIAILIVLSSWLSEFNFFGQSLMSILSIVALIIFYFKYGIRGFLKMKEFPLIIAFVIMAFSFIVSNFLGVSRHTPATFIKITNMLFILMIGWFVYKKSPDKFVKTFIKTAYIYGAIVSSYTLYEAITRSNPYIDFVNSMKAYSLDYVVTEIRFGIKRTQSFFSMHTTNGAVSLLLFCFLLDSYLKGYLKNKFAVFVICLLAFSTFSCGSRATILGIIISSIMFYKHKWLNPQFFVLIFTILCILLFFVNQYFIDIYNSFIDTSKVSGSNTDMRQIQYELAVYFMEQSFWFGNGITYTAEYARVYDKNLLGAESLWFPIMIEQGFVGVISYIVYFLSLIIYCFKNRSHRISFLIIGVLVANTLSSLPNFQVTYVFMYIYILIYLKKNRTLT